MRTGRAILGLAYLAIFSVMGLEVYANKWEQRQTPMTLENPEIISVDLQAYGLHKSNSTVRVRVAGEDRPIDFPTGAWDASVCLGRLDGDLEVRPSFRYWGLLDELDGLKVSR